MENYNSSNSLKKWILWFILVYIFLSIFPLPLSYLVPPLADVLTFPLDQLNLLIGKNILNIEDFKKIASTGSGDTTFDYVKILTHILLSIVSASVLIKLKKINLHSEQAKQWIVTYMKYVLAISMIIYGLAKVYEMQFPQPGLNRLGQSFGDSSPMGLLWTFMGHSRGYSIFTGMAEITGGVLLLFRRTQILGALISLGVMINVVALNFFFDVPVKIFSSHLFFYCLVLLYPSVYALIQIFLKGKSSALQFIHIPLQSKSLRLLSRSAKVFVIILSIALAIFEMTMLNHSQSEKSPHDGIHFVENFQTSTNHTNATKWNKLVMENKFLIIYTETDTLKGTVKINKENQLYFTSIVDSTLKGTLDFKSDKNNYIWNVVMKSDSLSFQSKIKRKEDFTLQKRGFHWINEYPYNR